MFHAAQEAAENLPRRRQGVRRNLVFGIGSDDDRLYLAVESKKSCWFLLIFGE